MPVRLNGFMPVWTLVDITYNILYNCTATFRTHYTSKVLATFGFLHKAHLHAVGANIKIDVSVRLYECTNARTTERMFVKFCAGS
jgi:hypothetical protein